jgi:hypothetical protein
VNVADAVLTRVTIVETGQVIDGATSVNAPFLASELLATVLPQAPAGATVRIEMTVPVLLTFSFELRAPVVERLGALGAAMELCINVDEPRLADFACYQDGVHLHVWTGDRDPHEVTARTGLIPTHVHRAGDRLEGPRSRIVQRGSWTLEYEREPAVDPSQLARELCDQFSTAAAAACSDYDLRLRFTFMIERLRGGLRFERDALTRIAALHLPLACYFYNMGA